ncbi:MAG: cupin domain-containing protein [Proteobacteria bacterium]|nr:cupin domain-containing protein [Pseudomonadota bacterium]
MPAPPEFQTGQAAAIPDAIAPDGSEVRLLCAGPRASMALFTLPLGAVARAVVHRTVEELWYVVAGTGRIWRRQGQGREEIVALQPGGSISLPTGTSFQFRCDGAEPLVVVGATMPPWPGAEEAVPVPGIWEPTG